MWGDVVPNFLPGRIRRRVAVESLGVINEKCDGPRDTPKYPRYLDLWPSRNND